MRMIYIASSGNTYAFTGRMPIRSASFHSWAYDPKTVSNIYGERVSYFKRNALKYSTTITIKGNATQRKAILTALHDDFERDVRLMQTGRLYFGDWYANCYVTSSETEPDGDINHWTNNNITFYVPSGFWVKDEEHNFESTIGDGPYDYLDYEYDYQYDYKPTPSSTGTWITESPFESEFLMSIHGPAVNPRVTINGYPYVVYASIGNGETLVIDSAAKTVMCGDTNLFDSRNKVQSVFQKIPSGNLTISWGNFNFDLVLHEERSEPRW